MKGYSAFPKGSALHLVSEYLLGESYLSTEMQSVYSAAPADWVSTYLGESRDLQYFDNVRNNVPALNGFPGVVKTTKHTGL